MGFPVFGILQLFGIHFNYCKVISSYEEALNINLQQILKDTVPSSE